MPVSPLALKTAAAVISMLRLITPAIVIAITTSIRSKR